MRAFIVLYRAFRSSPPGARLHTLIRFVTSPMLRVVDQLPRGGSLLDIGAGHGVLAVLARERVSRVVAVEPDVRKVLGVRRQSAPLHFVIGYDDVVRGSFDVISIIDVLYKIPTSQWDALIARAASRLKPGGTLIIKEMDPTERLKNRWNRIQERFASLLGLTLGESFSYEAPADFIARLARHGFEARAERIDAWYPHPHLLYVAKLLSR
jgi:2-polyprenyl-3-methyl-5-hydroxy-6-metoxy-1,4-benzoquinol methylase